MDLKKLDEYFTEMDIEWRIGRSGFKKDGEPWATALAYVTNRAIQNRLDEVCGKDGWKNEFKEWHDESQLCGISIKINDEWITKWDGADKTNFEATKGGLSDSMKRAAYQWGIGRYLYQLDEMIVKCSNIKVPAWNFAKVKKDGKYVWMYWQTPEMPKWALPKE